MMEFADILTSGSIPQEKATAGFATGAILLAVFVALMVAQLMVTILEPSSVAGALQAPLGVVGP